MDNCLWIGSSPTLEPTCCSARLPGRSYCTEHIWRVYREGTAQRPRRARRTRPDQTVEYWTDLFDQALAELELEGQLSSQGLEIEL